MRLIKTISILLFVLINSVGHTQTILSKIGAVTCDCIKNMIVHSTQHIDSFNVVKICSDNAILDYKYNLSTVDHIDFSSFKSVMSLQDSVDSYLLSHCNNLQLIKLHNDTVKSNEEEKLISLFSKYGSEQYAGVLISYMPFNKNYLYLTVKSATGVQKRFLFKNDFVPTSQFDKNIKEKSILVLNYRNVTSEETKKQENLVKSLSYRKEQN